LVDQHVVKGPGDRAATGCVVAIARVTSGTMSAKSIAPASRSAAS
jgi:hypothetical protein